jgi:hypothetical protein
MLRGEGVIKTPRCQLQWCGGWRRRPRSLRLRGESGSLALTFVSGLGVEAALLLMDGTFFSELLADEEGLRCKLSGIADSGQRARKISWLVDLIDSAVGVFLPAGMMILAKSRRWCSYPSLRSIWRDVHRRVLADFLFMAKRTVSCLSINAFRVACTCCMPYHRQKHRVFGADSGPDPGTNLF